MDQLIACLAIVAFVVALFVLGDRLLARERRAELGGWLLDELPAEARVDSLPNAFLEWFDRLFRVRKIQVLGTELVLPRFGRSALASFLALVAAFVVWLANKGGLSSPPSSGTNVALLVLMYGGATVLTNIIPDYLSLVESRFVLGKLSESRSPLAMLGWLLVDIVATAAIVFTFLWVSGTVLLPLVPDESLYAVGCLTADTFDFARMLDIAVAGLTFSTPPGTLNYDVSAIYIYSSFFTSFWVWLYLGSSVLVRVAQRLPALREFLRDACRVQDYPLRVLSIVSGLVAVALFLAPAVVEPLLPAERRGTNGMDGNIHDIDLCRERLGYPTQLDSFAGHVYVDLAPDLDFADLPGWSSEAQMWADYWRPLLGDELRFQF